MTNPTDTDVAAAPTWAIVELMGHRRLAGMVSEETRFGVAMCRIDVPAIGDIGAFTQWYGGASIYAMTPVSEQVALGVAAGLQARPVSVWDIAKVAADPQRRLALEDDRDRDRIDDDDDDDRPF